MKNITKVLSIFLFILGVSAVFGAWAINFTDNMMKFPPDILTTTPFRSFVIPGLILAFIVGGTQVLGACLLWLKKPYMYEATALAGFTLLLWICTEIFMIPSHHWIQIVYLGFAVITLIATMLLLKYRPTQ